ncbi:MAG: amidohydrolase family protein [Fuerstiella sp.]
MQIRARHFETLQPIDLIIEGDTIQSICTVECSPDEAASLPFVCPGFFDIQINGFGGVWFSSPELTVDQVSAITQALVDRGIARFFPTLITASFEALQHGFSTLRHAREAVPLVAAAVEGYHLEGPYISPDDGPRGAHPLKHVRAADYEEFSCLQDAAAGQIKLITLAAEAENAVPFIRKVREQGVVVSLGHMAASAVQIQAAVDAGATLSTHLGNGAHGILPRHPNYLWDQLAEDRLSASVIADGWHLPESVLRCILKCKTLANTILTCDVSGFAGCPPGVYAEGDVGVEVLPDGRLVVAGQRQFLAGSGATTGDCVVHMMQACGIELATAVRMATTNPAQLMGMETPTVDAGQPATLSVFCTSKDLVDGKIRFLPISTYLQGRLVSGLNTT